jgi:hypothetical protein
MDENRNIDTLVQRILADVYYAKKNGYGDQFDFQYPNALFNIRDARVGDIVRKFDSATSNDSKWSYHISRDTMLMLTMTSKR